MLKLLMIVCWPVAVILFIAGIASITKGLLFYPKIEQTYDNLKNGGVRLYIKTGTRWAFYSLIPFMYLAWYYWGF